MHWLFLYVVILTIERVDDASTIFITQSKWEEVFSLENLLHPRFINS
ncbi:hypothetical protein ACSX1A_14760 [Pontibacter sp. MBLB2868]